MVEIEVTEKRETQKTDRGVVTFYHRVKNQVKLVLIKGF
jgi:acyl dehydratase